VTAAIVVVAATATLVMPAEARSRGKPGPEPGGPSIELLAIDTNVSGNAPVVVGAVESCASAPAGTLVTIDIVVDSIPEVVNQQGGILGFQFDLLYKKRALSVVSVDNAQILTANAGSSPLEFTEPLPDGDGRLVTIYVDLSETAPESGAGVLSRITLKKMSRASTAIEIVNPIVVDASNNTYVFGEVRGARIVSREGCR
jgi:hypothetical protein